MANNLRSGADVISAAKICCSGVAAILVCMAVGFAAKPRVSHSAFHGVKNLGFSKLQLAKASGRMDSLPKLFFWAWERPEDLRFLGQRDAGVAFLAKTIYLPTADQYLHQKEGGSLIVRPRMQPLRVAPGTPLIAVVRIETHAGRQPAGQPLGGLRATAPFTTLQQEGIVDEILAVAGRDNVRAIQIDMDATASERAFYSDVLIQLRRKLPASVSLSITALASWCIGDRWLTALPPDTIDEAVPMLFRMGAEGSNVARYVRSGKEFPVAACQLGLGVSTDEPLSDEVFESVHGRRGKRVYVFAPRAWTQSAAEAVLQEWHP
jgi:hypothetical protein